MLEHSRVLKSSYTSSLVHSVGHPGGGGEWERLVLLVKTALKKMLGVCYLTRMELETTLHEVEACINS